MLKRHFKQLICSYEFALHTGINKNARNLEHTGHLSPHPRLTASVFSLPQQSNTLRRNTSHQVIFSAMQKKYFRAMANCRQGERTLYIQPEETLLMKKPKPHSGSLNTSNGGCSLQQIKCFWMEILVLARPPTVLHCFFLSFPHLTLTIELHQR